MEDALRCDINTITQLFAGGLTVAQARELGLLKGGNSTMGAACDSLLFGRVALPLLGRRRLDLLASNLPDIVLVLVLDECALSDRVYNLRICRSERSSTAFKPRGDRRNCDTLKEDPANPLLQDYPYGRAKRQRYMTSAKPENPNNCPKRLMKCYRHLQVWITQQSIWTEVKIRSQRHPQQGNHFVLPQTSMCCISINYKAKREPCASPIFPLFRNPAHL